MTVSDTTNDDSTQLIQIPFDQTEDEVDGASPRALPQFATAVRGYDRAQVDDYLLHFHEWMEEAEVRTRRAEEAATLAMQEAEELRRRNEALEQHAGMPTPNSMTAFGNRIGEVLEEAVRAARGLMEEAEDEARQLRERALEEGDGILQRAQDEAGHIVDAARHKEEAIQAHIADLGTQRSAALSELGSIRARLAELLETQIGGAGPAASGISPDEPYDVEATGIVDMAGPDGLVDRYEGGAHLGPPVP